MGLRYIRAGKLVDGTGAATIVDGALSIDGDPTVDISALKRIGAVFSGGERVR